MLKKMTSLERKHLYEAIWEHVESCHYGIDEFEESIIFDNYKIDYRYFSTFDEETDETESKIEVLFIQKFDYIELLKSAKVEYEKSRISESVYIKLDENRTVRVSTHKRPDYEFGGVYYTHEYYQDYVLDNKIEMYKIIEKLLNEMKG